MFSTFNIMHSKNLSYLGVLNSVLVRCDGPVIAIFRGYVVAENRTEETFTASTPEEGWVSELVCVV